MANYHTYTIIYYCQTHCEIRISSILLSNSENRGMLIVYWPITVKFRNTQANLKTTNLLPLLFACYLSRALLANSS